MVMRLSYPFDALRELQRALEESRVSDWFGSSTTSRGAYPPVNLFQQGDDFVVVAELPGVKKDEIEIQMEKNKLRLAGKKNVVYDDQVSLHRRERVTGEFDRSIGFPVEVDAEGVRAEFREGLLAVFIPRAEASRPRNIEIA